MTWPQRRDAGRGYETASLWGRSAAGIERSTFGGGIIHTPPGTRAAPDLATVRSTTGTAAPMRDVAVVGMATVYMKAHRGRRGFEVYAPGAFCDSVRSSRRVAFLGGHSWCRALGTTTEGTLELHETDAGLAFKLLPPDDDDGRKLLADVRAGRVQMSIGHDADAEVKVERIAGEDVHVIRNATLREISAVESAAVPETWLAVVPAADVRDLKATVRSYHWPAHKLSALLKQLR